MPLPHLEQGHFYLKGGYLAEEIKESKLKAESYPLSAYFKDGFLTLSLCLHTAVVFWPCQIRCGSFST